MFDFADDLDALGLEVVEEAGELEPGRLTSVRWTNISSESSGRKTFSSENSSMIFESATE